MATDLIPFSFESYSIRVLTLDGNPWFVATDIAAALDYRNAPDMTRNLDDDEKGTHNLRTLGGNQELSIINESGLYSAILGSRKPEAKKFKKWITAEVLPTLRKTGSYHIPGADARPESRKEFAQLHAMLRDIGHARDAFTRQSLIQLAQPLFETLGIPMPGPDLAGQPADSAMTRPDREPEWRRILTAILTDIQDERYPYPHAYRRIDAIDCLILRTSHIMAHLRESQRHAAFWKSLFLRSDRTLKRQLIEAGVVVRLRHNPLIDHDQFYHAIALNLQSLALTAGMEVAR